MKAVELRHLRYFIAVAEHLNFGQAAKALGMAQPPLSQQIQRLERAVGHPLFVRRPAVRLTAAGEALLSYARNSLSEARAGLAAAREAGAGSVGRLRIGFAASTLLSPLGDVIGAHRSALPRVELELLELSTADQVAYLRQGRIDVGFLRMPPNDCSGLVVEPIRTERFSAALPPSHPHSGSPTISLDDLRDEKFILFPREVSPHLYDQVHRLFRRSGYQPAVVMEAREWVTIVGLVESGIGVSIVPESFRRLRWGHVAYSVLEGSEERTSIFLGTTKAEDAILSHFLKLTRRIFREASRAEGDGTANLPGGSP